MVLIDISLRKHCIFQTFQQRTYMSVAITTCKSTRGPSHLCWQIFGEVLIGITRRKPSRHALILQRKPGITLIIISSFRSTSHKYSSVNWIVSSDGYSIKFAELRSWDVLSVKRRASVKVVPVSDSVCKIVNNLVSSYLGELLSRVSGQ